MEEMNLDSAIDSIASDMGQGSAVQESPPPVPAQEPTTPAPPIEEERKVIKPAEEAATTPATEAVPQASGVEPPKTWRPEAAAAWATLPKNVQEEIVKREQDMFKGIEQYKGQAAAAQPLLEAVNPFMSILQQHGIPPATMVKNLLNAQYMLSTGSPQQKTAMLQKLAQDYNIEWGADAGMIDPQVNQIDQRISRIEQQYTQDIRAKTMREVETFVSELGQDGKALRPYFDDVANDIVGLINSGQATDLQSAYEKAIWLNPVTRGKEIERANAAAAATAKQAAEEARKAEAANVKTSAKAVTAGSPTGSMDDTLMETLKAIKSKAA